MRRPARSHDRPARSHGRRDRHDRSRLARRAGVVLGAGALVAVSLVAVFPTRTWLDQRSSTAEAGERLGVLREQNAALRERIDELGRDDEIERLAREEYNLVRPGEEAYAVLPPPLPPLDLPAFFPFGELLPPDNGAAVAPGTAGQPGAEP